MSDTEDKSSKKKSGANSKTYEERCEAVNVICHPLASEKSTKKIHKLVKKASSKKVIRRGVKEVIKGIRKGEKGLAILAGDIYPVDVISHIPILLEEKEIPYLFVPSKQDLGAAACTKRPTSVVLIKSPLPKEFDGQELYDKLSKEAKTYDPSGIMSRWSNGLLMRRSSNKRMWIQNDCDFMCVSVNEWLWTQYDRPLKLVAWSFYTIKNERMKRLNESKNCRTKWKSNN